MEAEGSVEATEETTETGVRDTRVGEAMEVEAATVTTREEVEAATETIREEVDTEDMGECEA